MDIKYKDWSKESLVLEVTKVVSFKSSVSGGL